MKIITDEIVYGKNSLTRLMFAKHNDIKLKIAVKSDTMDEHCTANLYKWNKHKDDWKQFHSLAPMSMRTPTDMIMDEYYTDEDDYEQNAKDDTQEDVDYLLEMAKELI